MSAARRFCKPLDMVLLRRMAREHPVMITVEENGIGGFGSHGAPAAPLQARMGRTGAAQPVLLSNACARVTIPSHAGVILVV